MIIKAAPGQEPGWTSKYGEYLEAVRLPGPSHRLDPQIVSHAFSSQAEAEAYCIGAGQPWPLPLHPAK